MLHRLLPDDGEVAGLLALMLLTDARRAARTTAGRRPGAAGRAGPRPVGPGGDRRGRGAGQRRAGRRRARARTSCRRRSPRCTTRRPRPRTPTGRRSSLLYRLLAPVRTRARWSLLNRAVAVAMVHGPAGRPRRCSTAGRRRADGRPPPARRGARAPAGAWPATSTPPATQYRLAARRTTSLPEQRYLQAREARLRRP